MADPLDRLLQQVESALRAKQLVAVAPAQTVERELLNYRASVEHAVAADFAREHSLKSPAPAGKDPEACARSLLAAVKALPELASEAPRPPAQPSAAQSAKPRAETNPGAEKSTIPEALPGLSRAITRGPVVILGGLVRQDRLARIPVALHSSIEWIDTNRGGSHAIGNLAQRIRQRRVAGLIIIDGQVSHKHTDPIMAATRDVNVPAAYAGKGGQSALLRAVLDLEKMLVKSS